MRVIYLLLLAIVDATPLTSRASAGPLATLRDGSVLQGITDGNVDRFLGVRYAAAPVSGLRFATPKDAPSPAQPPPPRGTDLFSGIQNQRVDYNQTIFEPRGVASDAGELFQTRQIPLANDTARAATDAAPAQTVDATAYGPQCPQSGDSILIMDEDCLFLNINRPTGIPITTLLPTLVYMHGGGQQSGSGSSSFANFLAAANNAGTPIMVVSLNYRLSILGFMASTEFKQLRQEEPDADVNWNLAYHDFRKAIEWVKKEGAAFGVDTDKITIWGQSAGSFGVAAQIMAYPVNGGDDGGYTVRPPYTAAIMESGSPAGAPIAPVKYKDEQYARVLALSGCATDEAEDGKSLARTHLDCLRQRDWQTLRAVHLAEASRASNPNTYPLGVYAWTAALDGGPCISHNNVTGFYAGPPSTIIAQGQYADVPMIAGNNQDEGTQFTPQGIFDDAQLADWLVRCFFLDAHSDETRALFAEILNQYSDDPTIGSPFIVRGSDDTDRFYGVNNQYKRGAAIYGDIRFQSNRRILMRNVAEQNRTAYSFLYANFSSSTPPSQGVPHTTDLNALLSGSTTPIGAIMSRQFSQFAYTGNPNADGLPQWPKYDADASAIEYSNGTIQQIKDDYRDDPINLLLRDDILAATSR